MPTYEITSPQGEVFEVTAPDGATEAEILAYAKNNMSSPKDPGFLGKISAAAQGSGMMGSAWEGIKNGATFGLGDELQAGIAAYTSAPFIEGVTLADSYDQALGELRQENQQAQNDSPISYLGGNIGGTLATGAGAVRGVSNAAPQLSGQIANIAATRPIATGASVGATQGGLAGFGNGEGDFSSRASNAANNAILGGVVGGVTGGVASAITGRLAARGNERLTSEQLRQKAGEVFKKADDIGGSLNGGFTDKFLDNLQFLRPQTKEEVTVFGQSAASKILDDFEKLRGQPLSYQGVLALDRRIADEADKFIDPITGKIAADGKPLLDIQRKLRNMVDSATDSDTIGKSAEAFSTAKEARKLWSQSIKLGDVERILQKADAADNKATVIKNGFAALERNSKKLNGYTEAEKKAIKAAARTGIGTDILKVFGSRLGPIISGSTVGIATANPIAGAAVSGLNYGASAAARRAAESIQKGKANTVADIIANGAPALRYTDPLINAGAVLPATAITIRPSDRRQ